MEVGKKLYQLCFLIFLSILDWEKPQDNIMHIGTHAFALYSSTTCILWRLKMSQQYRAGSLQSGWTDSFRYLFSPNCAVSVRQKELSEWMLFLPVWLTIHLSSETLLILGEKGLCGCQRRCTCRCERSSSLMALSSALPSLHTGSVFTGKAS